MVDGLQSSLRALLGSFVVAGLLLLVPATPAVAAAADDCGGGEIELLQDEQDLATIVGARVTGVGAECDGQPVGVQFLGNDAGDPALPAAELARAYSDEDPCTGAPVADGVLRGGAVEVLLCQDEPGVDGEHLTRLRLLTTLGEPAPEQPAPEQPAPQQPAPPVDSPEEPAGAPVPQEDLPMTGAELLLTVALGAGLVLVGGGLLRIARRRGVTAR